MERFNTLQPLFLRDPNIDLDLKGLISPSLRVSFYITCIYTLRVITTHSLYK